MKAKLLIFTAITTLASSFVLANNNIAAKKYADSDDEIENRIRSMQCLVEPRTDAYVMKRIQSFLRSRRDTEKMIGRSATYFSIFDQKLHEYKLPEELKYITVLETELSPSVVSHAGATGIWQLMPDVRSEFGLRIDNTVDERLDLLRATEAALKDIKRMYNAYENWELTLAGYNCGVGNLGRAMKKARSRDFNTVKKHLPQETQNYIPKFVAFTYLMKYYQYHGLKPQLPKVDLQVIDNVKVYKYVSLSSVAQVTGLPQSIIESLNPQYREGYIPATEQGLNLFVPRRVMGAVNDLLSSVEGSQPSGGSFNVSSVVIDENLPKLDDDPDYFKTTYTVGSGETLETLAEVFNCAPYNIMLWNDLSSSYLSAGQELVLYMPRVIPKKV